MKRAILVLLGLTPFLFGGLLNRLILGGSLLAYLHVIGVGMLLVWLLFGFSFCTLAKSAAGAAVLLNLPALAVFLLIAFQELAGDAFWMNAVGFWTQIFYLPLISVSYLLTLWSESLFPAYCAAFLLLLLSSGLGCFLRRAARLPH